MDKYLDYQLNNDDIAGFSLEDILAEFGAGKNAPAADLSADFDSMDIDSYLDDIDVKYYKSEKTVPPKQESIYMQDEFMDKGYIAAEDELFELDDILNEFEPDPGFTIDPEAEAAGAFVVAQKESDEVFELDLDDNYNDTNSYDSEDDYEDDEPAPSGRANKPGLFGFFRGRKSGKLGAMEDEARNIARRIREEEVEAEDETETDIDLYS